MEPYTAPAAPVDLSHDDPRMFDPRFREAFRPRRRVWAAMRSFKRPFTASDILRLTGVGIGEATRLLFGWEGRGLIHRLPNTTSFIMPERHRIAIDPPHTKSGPRRSTGRRSQRQRLWSAIRVLRTFDLPTLSMAAGTKDATTRAFVNQLEQARYVSRRGMTLLDRPLYGLICDSGPRHPVFRRRKDGAFTVLDCDDPNNGSTRRIRTIKPRRLSGSATADPSVDGGVC